MLEKRCIGQGGYARNAEQIKEDGWGCAGVQWDVWECMRGATQIREGCRGAQKVLQELGVHKRGYVIEEGVWPCTKGATSLGEGVWGIQVADVS